MYAENMVACVPSAQTTTIASNTEAVVFAKVGTGDKLRLRSSETGATRSVLVSSADTSAGYVVVGAPYAGAGFYSGEVFLPVVPISEGFARHLLVSKRIP
jgi:hypothetical protein